MANILCSPSKYVQGAGEMKKLGEYAQKYGKKALVLITESGYKRIEDVLKLDLKDMILNQCMSISTENVARQKLIVW